MILSQIQKLVKHTLPSEILQFNLINYHKMKKFYNKDTLEVGLDESGRGSLIGPVYIGAVILSPDDDLPVRDSKKLSKHKRLELKDVIEEYAIDYSVASIDNHTIDKINILHATIKGMHQALAGLNVEPELILVDGNYFTPPYKDIPYETIKGGDDIYASIAAASILAKVYHDKHIEKMCDENPELEERYKLLSNMGYGTQAHRDGIAKYGITEYHRKSFKTCCPKLNCLFTKK